MRNLLVQYLKDNGVNSKGSPFNKNCNHLFGNVFLVRTQAGLKQAIKQYASADKTEFPTFKDVLEYLRFQNTPDFSTMKFPILIEFIPMYFGYHCHDVYIKELN